MSRSSSRSCNTSSNSLLPAAAAAFIALPAQAHTRHHLLLLPLLSHASRIMSMQPASASLLSWYVQQKPRTPSPAQLPSKSLLLLLWLHVLQHLHHRLHLLLH
jgi:hypothetical protein